MKHKSKWLITELWIMKSLMINLLISIQLTLVVSNTWYIELSTIYPVLWSLSTWLKQTFLGILKFDTSNFFLCRTNFLAHWKVLCRYLKKLSKFTIPFPIFLLKLLQLCRQEWIKILQIYFLYSLFRSNVLVWFFGR